MVIEDEKLGRVAKPDFRFWISILILRRLSVENGHFSCFLAIISKTALTIFINFWYDLVYVVVHLWLNFQKILSSGSEVIKPGKVEKSLKNRTPFEAIFGGDPFISTEMDSI